MRFHRLRHQLTRRLSRLSQPLPLNNLRCIGRIFLASILTLWILWMVDTLQQRDVLHFLTGGERVLEEVAEMRGAPSPPKGTMVPHAIRPVEISRAARAGATAPADWLTMLLAVFRLPVLIVLGIITPLALFLWNWESAIYADTLNPYLMLLGAQAGSVIVGVLLLGEGIVPFLGMLYSGLRVLQIRDLLNPPSREPGPMPRPLRLVLRTTLLLWAFNTTALALHILWVTVRLLQGQGVA
jgi:hypothetical protein